MTGYAQSISGVLVVLFGLWLIAVGVLALLAPQKALLGLSKFASTNFINYLELTLRLAVGLAFIGASELSGFPQAFRFVGAFLVLTALVLMLIPRAWHAEYTMYWHEKLRPLHIRLLSPFSMVLGVAVIYAVVG